MIVQGVVAWSRETLEYHLSIGQFEIATADCVPLMGQLWALTTTTGGVSLSSPPVLTDGTGLWWLSYQRGDAGMQVPVPPTHEHERVLITYPAWMVRLVDLDRSGFDCCSEDTFLRLVLFCILLSQHLLVRFSAGAAGSAQHGAG